MFNDKDRRSDVRHAARLAGASRRYVTYVTEADTYPFALPGARSSQSPNVTISTLLTSGRTVIV